MVTVSAIPFAGYEFDHWEGPVATADKNPTSVTVDWPESLVPIERTVTAFFLPSSARYMLNVSQDGGTVRLEPSPQPPGGYPVNTTVTLTAYAQSGYSFSHWKSDLSGVVNPSSLLMDGEKSVTPVFNPTVEVGSQPSDAGTVTLDPAQPTHGYPAGTPVAVKATAAKGYRFDHWSGDLSGAESQQTFTMDGPRTITAHFAAQRQFPWKWVGVGVAGFFLLIFLSYFVRTEFFKS